MYPDGSQPVDGIRDYCSQLAGALKRNGVRADVCGLDAALDDVDVALLQYNPFAYGRWGLAPLLPLRLRRIRRVSSAGLAVVLHESYVPALNWRWALMGSWQRVQFAAVTSIADVIFTPVEPLALELRHRLERPVHHLPVGSNLPDMRTAREEQRGRLGVDDTVVVLAAFGTGHPSRLMSHVAAAAEAVHASGRHTYVLNLGADAPPIVGLDGGAIRLRRPGRLAPEALARELAVADVFLAPFVDGVSARRTTLMAALQHGLPVIGTTGPFTDRILSQAQDALLLVDPDVPAQSAEAAARLAAEPGERSRRGRAARALYEREFDWDVIATKLISRLPETRSGRRAAQGGAGRTSGVAANARLRPPVTIVAHEIADSGGMERQLMKLAEGLLAGGHRVTAVARRCELAGHPGLRHVRVPGPRRPFALAYPWFFLAGSLLTAWRRRGLVHTTGAIVLNRADASTIHFCHHAFARRADGAGRAKRATVLHRLNSRIGARLSLIAERLCYVPSRTAKLVAVSGGVARELRREFPRMASRVTVIVNGVDLDRFRPNDNRRRQARARFRLGDGLVMAFVGGEWQRKGLRHAIEALVLAPSWRLLVAGDGDEERYRGLARAAGVSDRVHFAGHIGDVNHVYAAADAFILPTTYEAFPLVSLEAAAAGLPLLIARVSGVEDLIIDGVNGWFVEHDACSIARRLQALTDPAQRERMGRSARDSVRPFSWDNVVQRYSALYAELAQDHRAVR